MAFGLGSRGKVIVIIILIVFSSIILLLTLIPPTIDFSIQNPFWNGYSTIASKLSAHNIYKPLNTARLNPKTDVLILIPYAHYSESEILWLKSFLRSGGVVVLLDDFGFGNDVLSSLGINIKILDTSILVDPIFFYRDGKLPYIIDFKSVNETKDVKKVLMDYASAINVFSDNAEVIAYSSKFSFLDSNFNGIKDEFESNGPYPVIVKARYGRGTLYIISDPSIIINSVVDINGDNYKLIKNIVDDRRVFIDQYHLRENLHYQVRTFIINTISYFINSENLPYTIAIIPILPIILIIWLFRRTYPYE